MALSDDEIVKQMAAEQANRQPFHLVLNGTAALQLAGLLQLAQRHPHLDTNNRRTAHMVVEQVRAYFATGSPPAPATLEVMRQGDDPASDRPWR